MNECRIQINFMVCVLRETRAYLYRTGKEGRGIHGWVFVVSPRRTWFQSLRWLLLRSTVVSHRTFAVIKTKSHGEYSLEAESNIVGCVNSTLTSLSGFRLHSERGRSAEDSQKIFTCNLPARNQDGHKSEPERPVWGNGTRQDPQLLFDNKSST